jgi:hypothetical protein
MAMENKDIELTANERTAEQDYDDLAAQEAAEDARKKNALEQSGGTLEVCISIMMKSTSAHCF